MSIPRSHALHLRFWGGHLVLIVALVGAGLLGWWQYAAWDAARAAEARDLSNAPAEPLTDVFGPDDPFPGDHLGRRVTLSGTWMPESTLYVSNRDHDGRSGFWVMTPVRVGDAAVPVIRGWSATPDADVPNGEVAVEGWLQAGEGDKGVDEDPHDDVITSVRIASMTEHVDRDLYSGYVVSVEPDSGLTAVPSDAVPPVGSNTALRNLMYAVQWLIFGGFAGFIWWRWVQDKRAEDEPDQPGESTSAPIDSPA